MKLPWSRKYPPVPDENGSELADLWWPYAAGRKVLVIEEHAPYLEYLETLLQRAGYEVISATEAADGVQKAGEERPDVIVMDRKLPTLRRFRSLDQLAEDPAAGSIPVVMVMLRDAGNYTWRSGDENVAHISGDPGCLVEMLRRIDLGELHRREAAHPSPTEAAQQRAVITQTGEKPKRVLVVDDEPRVIQFMEQHLRRGGYEVLSCFDGREVVERAKAEQPDAIALDLLMPFMRHWLKVFTNLKSDPVTANIPLVLVSSRHPGAHPSLWIPPDGSVAAFLVKPFSPSELLTAVAFTLKRDAPNLHSLREQS